MELNKFFGLPENHLPASRTFTTLLEETKGSIRSRSSTIEEYDIVHNKTAIESIIGIDERIQVSDTTYDPWRKICCLTIIGQNNAVSRGTAWFIGPRTLLTAGHCVYSTILFDGWAKEIVIEPGRNKEVLPFGSFSSTWFSTLRKWVETENPSSDIGCIQLDQPIGNLVGWFKLDTMFDDILIPPQITIAGYPVDRDNGNVMYYNRNRIIDSSSTQLFYDVDTFGGQSGAPILVGDYDDNKKAIGIHAYGSTGAPNFINDIKANSGLRFSSELLVVIASWLNENF